MLVYACRKPLCCINRCPNLITEQTPNQLNIKLCFDDDFVSAVDVTEQEDTEDNEITINPARRVLVLSYFCPSNICQVSIVEKPEEPHC